ncbi:phosphate ABC transporter permease PstA [Deinococcus peraridilitoris]|uniref:Phosphate transport system permease protein PstA n=1 Tax=Deinococcus peraridilitoris (strain DSM 19664 / LMG 22246 / CIP 109416 / KR-200) TaxID=937777 RepID=K9ZYQ5_DEIPD|nr:phosphate ABC transporter permease PstA [Deinococcus peraridilitoris]AFZ66711.1 phosphate ABC transporter, permease protein PstA [Deinococcus peraridilitoris DSM 19664]
MALAQRRASLDLSRNRRARQVKNIIAAGLIGLATLVILIPLFAILWYLISNGIQAINLDFFTQDPVPVGEAGGGLRNAIVGTLLLLAIASVIGVIIGVAGGIFLAEFPRHPLVPTVRLVSDVLSGVPAIVMGLVAYGLVVIAMRQFSALSGGIALGLLMIPIVVRTTEEVLKLVPLSVREAGMSLGLPQWRVTWSIVLPSATGGIITGVMLAVARVAGEAAPLLFTAFGNPRLSVDPLQPVSALPLAIFTYVVSPYEEWHRLANAAALVLVLLIFVTTLLARWATRRRF